MRTSSFASLLLFLACVACGNSPPPENATTAPSASATPVASSATSATPATSAAPVATDEAPNPAAKRPLDITSECADVVHVVYGEDPKGPGGSAIAQGGRVDAPRRPDGTQVVLLLDDKSEGIAKVTITKHMKHVVIGRSCRTMDAH